MSMSPFVEVMYGTTEGWNSDSQLELPGTYGFGLLRYGLMFCSSPAGIAPEVTGPYCSQTTSGPLPPAAWLSSWALDWVILDILFGSHWTVTFLWAASYWAVRLFRPALSAAVTGPVFGGSTALIVTAAPLPEPAELAEPPPEHPATRTPAATRAAPTYVLRTMKTPLSGLVRPGTEDSPDGEGEDEHGHEEQGADGHAVAVLVVLERRLVHVQARDQRRGARAAVGEQQDRDEGLHGEDAGQDDDDPDLRHQQRDVDREAPPDRAQAVQAARVQHVLGQVLQPAQEDQETQVGDPREPDQQDPYERQVRIAEPGRLGQPNRAEDPVDQPGPGLEQVRPDLDQHQRRQDDRQDEDVFRRSGGSPRHVHDDLGRGELGHQADQDAAADQNAEVPRLDPEGRRLDVLPELRYPGVGRRGEAVPLVEAADQAAHARVIAEHADQQQARQQQHRQHRPVAVAPPGHAPVHPGFHSHERHVHEVDPGRIRWTSLGCDEPLFARN